MKKIIITTGNDGGPQTYVNILKKHLLKNDFQVKIIAFNKTFGPKGIKHFLFFLKILLSTGGDTIIFAQDPVSVGLPSLWASKISGKKLLLKIVGDYAWEQGVQRFGVKDSLDEFLLKDHYHPFVKRLKSTQRQVAFGAEKIIVPSNYLKKVVSSWGIDRKKVIVINNSYNKTDLPAQSKKELRKKLGFDQNIILSVGRLVPWKGFEKLIEAIKDLDEVKLIIIGDGPGREKIKKSGVDFYLHKNHRELMEYIKAADVLALNTAYEGLSHVLIETMALGTPIATTNSGGNKELLTDKESALFFEYNNVSDIRRKIMELLENQSLRKKLSDKAKELSLEYREGNMVSATVMVINSLYENS